MKDGIFLSVIVINLLLKLLKLLIFIMKYVRVVFLLFFKFFIVFLNLVLQFFNFSFQKFIFLTHSILISVGFVLRLRGIHVRFLSTHFLLSHEHKFQLIFLLLMLKLINQSSFDQLLDL